MASLLESLQKRTPRRRGRFVAVDLDARFLWLVEAEHTGERTKLHRLSRVDVPGELDLTDAKAVGKFLADAMKREKVRGGHVVVSVPRGRIVLKPMTLPRPAHASELYSMIEFQLGKELSFSLEEAVIDFTIENHLDPAAEPAATGPDEESTGSDVDVLVAAARQDVIDYYRTVAEVAGVKLGRLGLRPYADMRAALYAGLEQNRESIALIHLASDGVEVNVIADQSLAFSRSSTMRLLPRLEAKATPDAEAKAGKQTAKPASTAAAPSGDTSTDEADDHEDDAFPLISNAVDGAVIETARTLQSFHAVQRGRRIDHIFVAGGTGIEKQVAEKLALRLRVPCEVFDATSAMTLPKDAPSGRGGFIGAVGLAVADADPAHVPFDFIDPTRPKPPLDVKRLKRWGAIGGAAAAVVLLIGAGIWHRSSAAADYNAVRNELSQAKEDIKPVKSLRRRVDALLDWSDVRDDWLEQWALISALMPPAKDAMIDGFSTTSSGRISFTVRTRESDDFAALAQRLQKAGFRVESRRTEGEPDEDGYNYSVDVRLTVQNKQSPDLKDVKPIDRSERDIYHPSNRDEAEELLNRRSRSDGRSRRSR